MAIERDTEIRAELEEEAGVDADLLDLLRIMPPVIRGLKRRHPEGQSGPPAAVRALLGAGGLGPRHLPVLVALALHGSTAVTDLSRRIGLGVPATSLMVGELARAGIVERQPDERDRRRTIVSISEELRGECERMARERLAPMRLALERMGPETRCHFLAGWRVLAETLDENENENEGSPGDAASPNA